MAPAERRSGDLKAPLPLFFVSHASPATDDPAQRADDELFTRFHEDLTLAVAQRLATRDRPALGYMVGPGAEAQATARALATCQVFVALCSPLYFKNEQCGKEWSAFSARVPEDRRVRCFYPVTWTPVSAPAFPAAAVDVFAAGTRNDQLDALGGVYALMVDEDSEAYGAVVADIAGVIAETARRPVLATTVPVDLNRARNAFTSTVPQLRLQVVILAPTRDELPEGRTETESYGAHQLDWAPYGGVTGRQVAEDAALVAERLGYAINLVGFDDVADQLLTDRQPTAPTVLLIDNWSLIDRERRLQVRAYVELNHPWYRFMVIRNPQDPETNDSQQRLQAVVNETLQAKLNAMRIDMRHASSGNGSPELFPARFKLVAETAAASFQRRSSRVREANRQDGVVGNGDER